MDTKLGCLMRTLSLYKVQKSSGGGGGGGGGTHFLSINKVKKTRGGYALSPIVKWRG